jgi:hypothetical protein
VKAFSFLDISRFPRSNSFIGRFPGTTRLFLLLQVGLIERRTEQWWNDIDKGRSKYADETFSIAVPTTNWTRTGPSFNPDKDTL